MIYSTKTLMMQHMPTLCQKFVLTPAVKVAVDPSVEKPPVLTDVIIPTNAHVKTMFHRMFSTTNMFPSLL